MTGFGRYHLATADGRCVDTRSVKPDTTYRLDPIVTSTGAGLPFAVPLADGPISPAGSVRLSARVTSLAPDSRGFFALSVGTTPADARIVQNNTMPLREADVVHGVKRTIDLPAVAVDVPAGKHLYLTVSPVADMFMDQSSRNPGVLQLDHLRLEFNRR
jgi:ABC-2 type transport system ATP-binding protein